MPRLVLACVMFLAALAMAACGNDDDETPPQEPAISVAAEILEEDAPASVEATTIRASGDGRFEHTVRVLWEGDDPGSLEDARFTHHVEGDAGGHFITAGRGCGAQWFDMVEGVTHDCTDDLHIIWLQPGETHEYPVAIYPEIERPETDPLRLEPGTYVIDEVIHWAITEDEGQPPGDDTHFTIRLTYTVQ